MKIAFCGLRSIGNCAGGIERHVEELAVRLAGLGHDVTVFCRKRYNEVDDPVYKGVRIFNLPAVYSKHFEAISHTALSMPFTMPFDVVHIHACGPSLLSWAPRLLGRKVVVTVHGLDHLRAKWEGVASIVLRGGAWTAIKCPHQTIVVSKELRSHYVKNYGKEPVYIPNGVTAPELRPVDKITRFGLSDKNYILFLGRLVPEKGAHYLIQAFRSLDTSLRLVVVGGATHMDAYWDHLRDLAGSDDRIVFTGPLYGQDKDEVFSNARFFVLPSDLEGMPIVLLEAVSYGCPVLVSDIPECTEVFSDGNESRARTSASVEGPLCMTFKAGNVDSLHGRLNDMLSSKDLEDMGQRARDFVLANYTWDAIVRKTLEVYTSIL